MSYQYDASGNITGLTYNYTSLTISGITIYTISGLVYPKISLSGLIYTPITISSYISISGLFTGYNTSNYYSLSGLINSNNIFNYLTSSSYISPFKTSYTISSYIFNIPNNQWLVNTDYNQLYSSYLAGVLDISGTLILRSGNFICNNIIDQYARNYELSLSGYVWSYYNNLGSQVNLLSGSSAVDQYARNYELSLSGYLWSYYNNLGSQVNLLSGSSGADQYARNYELSLSGYVWSYYKTLGNLINSDNNIDQYARDYELSLSGNVNSQAFRIGALEYKTTGITYNGSTAINSNLYMGSTLQSIYLSDGPLCLRGLGDQNHYIKYDSTRNGPSIGGYAGGSMGISVPSYSEIISYTSNDIYLNKNTTIAGNLVVQGSVLTSGSATITAPASGGMYFYNSSTTYIYVKSGVSGISINFTATNNKICQPVHIINTGSSISIVFAGSSGNTIITGTTASYLCFWTPWNDWMYYVL